MKCPVWQNTARAHLPAFMRSNHSVAFIGGAGHSGSTLLGLMLGAHPAVFYAGEAKKSTFLGNERKPLRKRACKLCGAACPVWGDLHVEDDDVYEALARRTGRAICVDSTKSIAWIERQAEMLERRGAERCFFFLARDGRAVLASRIRKYPTESVRAQVDEWVTQIRATEALVARFPGKVMRLHYEELAARPEATIAAAARFLGIEPEPAMIAPWTTEQHPLGGNNGTQSLMQREPGTVVELSERTRAHYGAHPKRIVLDLRWQRELSADALAVFEEVAGAVNTPYAFAGSNSEDRA